MSQDEPNTDVAHCHSDRDNPSGISLVVEEDLRLTREQIELENARLAGRFSIYLSVVLAPIALVMDWHAKAHGYPTPINDVWLGLIFSPLGAGIWIKIKQMRIPWGKK
ncbi:MAG: hypothetical protein K2Y22_04250 [Candidatus Obscuribacterales bacterium]|nr:hypothetical protein [Candidatus Obscuribacterales bacterium]